MLCITGRTIDGDGDKTVPKPVKNDTVFAPQTKVNQTKNSESKPKRAVAQASTENDDDETTKKTPSKKKKIDKHKVKKKIAKSPPSELDKELKELKDETDDVIFRNRTKFTVTQSEVTFADVAGSNGKCWGLLWTGTFS